MITINNFTFRRLGDRSSEATCCRGQALTKVSCCSITGRTCPCAFDAQLRETARTTRAGTKATSARSIKDSCMNKKDQGRQQARQSNNIKSNIKSKNKTKKISNSKSNDNTKDNIKNTADKGQEQVYP